MAHGAQAEGKQPSHAGHYCNEIVEKYKAPIIEYGVASQVGAQALSTGDGPSLY